MNRVFSFLYRNPDSGILYFRTIIPKRHRHHFGKREVKRSLKTRDKVVAMGIAMRLYCNLQQEYKRIEGGLMNNKKSQAIATEDELNRLRTEDDFLSFITFDELDLPSGGKAKGVTIDTGDPDKDMAVARELLGQTPTSQQPVKQQTAPSTDSIKLSDAAKKYRTEKLREGSWRKKTHDEHEALHGLLIQVLGNKHLETFTHTDGRKFKEILLALPPNCTKGIYAGKTVRKIIAMKPGHVMTVTTANEKLQKASGLFLWAVRQGYCQTNVFEGLRLKNRQKASEQKEAFTANDLRIIFDSSIFTRDKLNHPWRHWTTLLALFTGCRVSEIAQLRVCDVFEESTTYAIRITDEAGNLKNESSRRIVPLHPHIIQLGFIEYVQEMSSQERLFPDLYGTSKGPGDKVSRWFNNTHLKNCGLKGTGRKISFHSFRHTFIDAFKQTGVEEVKVKALTGHQHDSITFNRYGKDYALSVLYETLMQIDFDIN